jgi:hypothetical protein
MAPWSRVDGAVTMVQMAHAPAAGTTLVDRSGSRQASTLRRPRSPQPRRSAIVAR